MSQVDLVKVTINGKEVEVPKGTLLVEAAKAADTEIPVFCYHPKLDPAGVCRMCLVEVEGQRKPVTACTMPVADGMVVHTDTPQVKALQQGVLEFLLLNHPLDCPVCDKGGECPLQDNTFKYGPPVGRSLDPKVRKPKAVDLGQFIVFDQERCILCRRCTRFDDEITHERHLVVTERAGDSRVSTADGQPFNSYFSGNTIEMCPVGALTSDLYRFTARPWDLSRTPSVCTGCSMGCNVYLDFRFGKLLRVINREHPEIDGGWLCDRGRFNYQFVHGESRVTEPLIKKDGRFVPVSWDEAIGEIVLRMRSILRSEGGRAVGGVGGGRLTNEEAYLFQKFVRTALESPNVDWRTGEQIVASNAEFPGRISDISRATGILLVDLLPAERAPVADLRVRRAAERGKARLAAVGPALPAYRPECREFPALIAEIPSVLAGDELFSLYEGTERLVVLWSGRDHEVGKALLAFLRKVKDSGAEVHLLIPGEQANAYGAEAMGMRPDRLPGYKRADDAEARAAFERSWQAVLPAGEGAGTREMLERAAAGDLSALYLAGANLLSTYPDRGLVEAALDRLSFLVVQDLFLTETAMKADVVLPAAPFPVKEGTLTAFDGSLQRIERVMAPEGKEKTDAEIFAAVAKGFGVSLASSEQELAWEIRHALGEDGGERLLAAPSEMVEEGATARPEAEAVAGESLVLVPVERLYAGGGTSYFDEGLRRARPEPAAILHPDDARRLGLADGEPVSLRNERGELHLTVRLDAKVIPGTVQVIRGLPEAPANALGAGQAMRAILAKPVAEEVG